MSRAKKTLPDCYRTALVTGASSGLGQAFAETLLSAGLTVYGTSRDPESLPERGGIRWLAFEGRSSSALEAFVEEHHQLLTSIDVLVNNAGQACFGKAFQEDTRQVEGQLHLLLSAPLRLTSVVLQGMRERGHGAVVNVSSLASIFPLPYMAPYSAGKAGLSAYTQSLMISEQASGVVILDFQAGDLRTAFNRNMPRSEPQSESEEAAWRKTVQHLEGAPGPEVAVQDLLRALRRGRSGVVRSGGFFQTRIAPLGLRFLPAVLLRSCLRFYFGIPRR